MRTIFFNKLTFVILLTAFIPAVFWRRLEDLEIPVHFNILTGDPDGWGGRGMLFVLWGLAVVVYVLMMLSCKYPQMINYPARMPKEEKHKLYPLGKELVHRINYIIMLLFSISANSAVLMALGNMEKFPIWIVWILLAYLLGVFVKFTIQVRKINSL